MPKLLKITEDYYLKCEKPNHFFLNMINFVSPDLFKVHVVSGIPWELSQHVSSDVNTKLK